MVTRVAKGGLLERERELGVLAGALEGASDGRGAIVVIEGPPGIGKTALLDAAGELAATRGVEPLMGRCDPLEREFAFGVARQAFEPKLAQLGGPERVAALAGAAALAEPIVGASTPPPQPERADRLYPLLHGLFWLVSNLATIRPLLLVIDDAQWADEQSLTWLSYLGRRIETVPAVLTVAVRPGEAGRAGPGLEALRGSAEVMRPSPLSLGAAGELIGAEYEREPAPEFVSACHARTEGNPYLLRELARSLVGARVEPTADGARAAAGARPEAVERSVRERLRALPSPAADLAVAVAVLGSDSRLGFTAALAGVEEDEAPGAIDALRSADLLAGEGGLRFAHPLVAEAVRATVGAEHLAVLHGRAARLLVRTAAEPERIAAHLLEAEPAGDREAIDALRAAARRAGERGAPAAVALYLSRALEEGPSEAARAEILVELGAAEARLGREDSVPHLEAAVELATSPPAKARAVRELAVALTGLNRPAEAAAAFDRGIAEVKHEDRELELTLIGELEAVRALDVSGDAGAPTRTPAYEELEGRTPGERLVLASYAHRRSIAGAAPSEVAELAQRALADGRLLRDQTSDSPIYYLLMFALHRDERLDLIDATLAAAVEDARRRGSLLGISTAFAVRGYLGWLGGSLRQAEADARASIDAQLEAGWTVVLPIAVAAVAECLLERDQADEGARIFDRCGLGGALPDVLPFRLALATRGRVRIGVGHTDDGLRDLLDCERESMGPRPSLGLLWRSSAAIALANTGERERALKLASEEVEHARRARARRPLGIGLRTLGLVTGGEQGVALLRLAVDTLAQTSARLELTRARVELGAALRRSGRRREARESLREGLEAAERCGSLILTERARQELAAAGARPRRPRATGTESLTPSEQRVAEMAASGMTNAEIAQALFVTRKTIEMHLSRVYRKLSVAGRDELEERLARPSQSA
jgi:DNA-binding CsgD family transcriptional regulator